MQLRASSMSGQTGDCVESFSELANKTGRGLCPEECELCGACRCLSLLADSFSDFLEEHSRVFRDASLQHEQELRFIEVFVTVLVLTYRCLTAMLHPSVQLRGFGATL